MGDDGLVANPGTVPDDTRARTGKRHRVALFVVLGLVGVLACCACATLLFLYTDVLGGQDAIIEPMWAEDGRFLVFEYDDGFGESTVVSYDTERDALRRVEGFSLASVEPSAPTAWLIPRERYPGRMAGYDSPASEVFAWKLDRQNAPSRARQWAPWPNTIGMTALLEVDPAKGAWPSKIGFISAGTGDIRQADLTARAKTFEPLGWSPSGRFFAVLALPPGGSRTAFFEHIGGDDVRRYQVIVIDAEKGTVVGSSESSAVTGSSDASWFGTQDTVIILDTYPFSATWSLRSLQPSGDSVESTAALEVPALQGPVSVIGVRSDGFTVSTGYFTYSNGNASEVAGGFWRVSPSGSVSLPWRLPNAGRTLLSSRGLVAYEPKTGDTRLVLSWPDGSDTRVIWSAEDE